MIPGAQAQQRSDFVRARQTEFIAARHLVDVVDAIARRMPDKPFLTLRTERDRTRMSYGRLARRAADYAAALRARGLAPGASVVIMLGTSAEMPPLFLGAMRAGLVPSLFPPPSPKQDPAIFWEAQQGAFARLEIGVLVIEAAFRADFEAQLPDLADRAVDIAALAPDDAPEAEAAAAPDISPGGLAFLQHSSGTTGTKKGVMLTHRAVLDFMASIVEALDMREDDVCATWLPAYHDMGLVGNLIVPMLLGHGIVQLDAFEWVTRPLTLLDAIAEYRATICWLPNFAYHHIMRAANKPGLTWDLASLRLVIDAGEPCKPDTLASFRARFAECGLAPGALQVAYGMAENVLMATTTARASQPRVLAASLEMFQQNRRIAAPGEAEQAISFLSVGSPIPGVSLRILDDEGNALPERAVGEIALASPFLFSGYFRITTPQTVLSDGWYRSRDLGFIDGGELFCCGRADDLLIVNGKNLYAHDIEFAVNGVAGVKSGRAVAVAPFSARTGSRILVVIAETEAVDPAARTALRRAIIARVHGTFGLAPTDVLVTDPGWLIKTTSGKIGRGANERRYAMENPGIVG